MFPFHHPALCHFLYDIADILPLSRHAKYAATMQYPSELAHKQCSTHCELGTIAKSRFQKVLLGDALGKVNKAGKRTDVWDNFRDYNLMSPVGLIRADAHRPPFRANLQVMSTVYSWASVTDCMCKVWQGYAEKRGSVGGASIRRACHNLALHRSAFNLASLRQFSTAFWMIHGHADVQMSLLLQDMFDAIICDPPYGVRAGGKKSVAKSHKITCAETHIPSTDAYTFEECLRDLLHLAAKHLKLGGRLVFFLPSVPGVDKAGFSISCTVIFHMHAERNKSSSKLSWQQLL